MRRRVSTVKLRHFSERGIQVAQKQAEEEKIRLDKWLWAARFYKTRALAKAAIESGKVHHRGERCKPGKEPRVGDELLIRTGFDERLSWSRRSVCVVAPPKRSRCTPRPKPVSPSAKARRPCAGGCHRHDQRPMANQARSNAATCSSFAAVAMTISPTGYCGALTTLSRPINGTR